MIQNIKPHNTQKTLEFIARKCQDNQASLRRPVNGNGDYRCYSMPLEHKFCPYQKEVIRIEETNPKSKIPFPVQNYYYLCGYNGGNEQ